MNCINSSNRQIIALSAQLETVYHGLHNLHMITQVCVITAGFHGLETAVDQPDVNETMRCWQSMVLNSSTQLVSISPSH